MDPSFIPYPNTIPRSWQVLLAQAKEDRQKWRASALSLGMHRPPAEAGLSEEEEYDGWNKQVSIQVESKLGKEQSNKLS